MKTIITPFIVFLLVVFTNIAFSQITFQKTYSSGQGNGHSAMTRTNDNGYILAGVAVNSLLPGIYYLNIIKLDSNGNYVWRKFFGDSAALFFEPSSIQLCTDGGFILCGSAIIHPLLFNKSYLIKVSSMGNVLWCRIFEEELAEELCFVTQTNDGGFAACGYSSSSPLRKCLLIKTDSNGILQWSKSITDTNTLYGFMALHLSQTSDIGFIICGATRNTVGDPANNSTIIKTDSSGNTQWMRSYGTPYYDEFKNVYETADGGFMVGGSIDATNDSIVNPYYLLLKTDSAGVVLWAKTFGISNMVGYVWYHLSKLLPLSDGSYQLNGAATNLNGNFLLYSVNADSNGNYLSSKTHMEIVNYEGIDMLQTLDSGFFIAALGPKNPIGSILKGDSYFIKTDKNCNSFCTDSIPAHVTGNINLPLLSTSFVESVGDSTYSWPLSDTTSYVPAITAICFSTGIDKINEQENLINVYPNPFTNSLSVTSSNNQQVTITIYDIISRKLLQKQFTNAGTLNTIQLSKGIYIYSVSNKNGVVKKGKVVKE